jgi:Ca2+-binding EF-hand superfamily protein
MVSGISGCGMNASAMWQDLLQRADTDGDGKISKKEFEASKPKDGKGPAAEDLFSKIDTNGDGFITEDENAVFISSMQPPQPPSPEEMFAKADTNGDGELSKAEFAAMVPKKGGSSNSQTDTQKIFDEMDTNQDGVVSEAEFMAAMEKRTQNGPPLPEDNDAATLA